jgi:hypothetical protein
MSLVTVLTDSREVGWGKANDSTQRLCGRVEVDIEELGGRDLCSTNTERSG